MEIVVLTEYQVTNSPGVFSQCRRLEKNSQLYTYKKIGECPTRCFKNIVFIGQGIT